MATQRLSAYVTEDLLPHIRDVQISVARSELALAQAKGFDRDPRTIVDRRFDAMIESVRPFGVIEFVSRVDIGEVVEWIWNQVIKRSPVESGRYQDSHIVMINGASVPDVTGYEHGDRIQIVNTQPYSRKIEKGQSIQAPHGVYRSVFRAAKRRYGKNLFIDYKFVKLDLGVKVWGFQGGANFTATRSSGDITRRQRIQRDQIYPAIQLYQGNQ